VRPQPKSEAAFPIPVTHPDFSRGNPSFNIVQKDGEVQVQGAWPDRSAKAPDVGTILSGGGPDMALSIKAGVPNSSDWIVTQNARFVRDDWDCAMKVRIEMTSDEHHYFIDEELVALEKNKVVFTRRRKNAIERI
jgi:hypothetical protein